MSLDKVKIINYYLNSDSNYVMLITPEHGLAITQWVIYLTPYKISSKRFFSRNSCQASLTGHTNMLDIIKPTLRRLLFATYQTITFNNVDSIKVENDPRVQYHTTQINGKTYGRDQPWSQIILDNYTVTNLSAQAIFWRSRREDIRILSFW